MLQIDKIELEHDIILLILYFFLIYNEIDSTNLSCWYQWNNNFFYCLSKKLKLQCVNRIQSRDTHFSIQVVEIK